MSTNRNYPHNWFRRPCINWNIRAIDLGYCLSIGIARTIDLESGQLIGVVRTVYLGYRINWNCPHKWFRMRSTNWNCPDNWFGILSFNRNCPHNWFRRRSTNWNCPDNRFYKKLKNVSCEYDRLNGWNSTLQAAWYIRHVRIMWFLWTGFCQVRVRRRKSARGRDDVIDLEKKLRSGLGFGCCLFCRQ